MSKEKPMRRRDVLMELEQCGGSEAGFATQLNVPLSWVQYWIELARWNRLAACPPEPGRSATHEA